MFLITISSPLREMKSGTCLFLKSGDSPETAWRGIGPCTTVIGQTFFGRTTERTGGKTNERGNRSVKMDDKGRSGAILTTLDPCNGKAYVPILYVDG